MRALLLIVVAWLLPTAAFANCPEGQLYHHPSWHPKSFCIVITSQVASADGTTIPSAAVIEDNALNLWTLTANVVYENGTSTGSPASIDTVLWYNNEIVIHSSSTNLWYIWNGSTWPQIAGDPRGVVITPGGSTVLDNHGNTWQVTSGNVCQLNSGGGYSTPTGGCSSTTSLLYYAGEIYVLSGSTWSVYNYNSAKMQTYPLNVDPRTLTRWTGATFKRNPATVRGFNDPLDWADESMQQFINVGANVARLFVNLNANNATIGSVTGWTWGTSQATVQAVFDAAAAWGIKVIAVMQTRNNSGTADPTASALWSVNNSGNYVAAQADWASKAQWLAALCYSNPVCAGIDLINEPVVSGAAQTDGSTYNTQMQTFASTVISSIRAVNPNSVIVFEPTPWSLPENSFWTGSWPFTDVNVIASSHLYHPFNNNLASFPSVTYGAGTLASDNYMSTLSTFVSTNNIGFLVGEFGCKNSSLTSPINGLPSCNNWAAEMINDFDSTYHFAYIYHVWREYLEWHADADPSWFYAFSSYSGNTVNFSQCSSNPIAGCYWNTTDTNAVIPGIANSTNGQTNMCFASKSGTVTITIASPGVLTLSNHGLANNQVVTLTTTGALPTGFTASTYYFVINATQNTFQLATSRNGAAINTSGSQSGTHTVHYYGANVATVTITNASPAVVTWTGHGLVTGQKVFFESFGGSLPTGISDEQVFSVIVPTTNTFEIAPFSDVSTGRGSATNTSSAGSGTFFGFASTCTQTTVMGTLQTSMANNTVN